MNFIIVLFKLVILFFYTSNVACDCPDIITRKAWNATAPTTDPVPLRQNPPPYIVVHHSATDSCFSIPECKKLVKSIQRYHMVNNGWDDIGYNFLIGGDGSIYEGRGWGIHGAHVVSYNARSLGICLLGTYSSKDPPAIQIYSLESLILCAQSTNKTIEDYHLIGHRQGSATSCPGNNLFEIIKQWPHFDPSPN